MQPLKNVLILLVDSLSFEAVAGARKSARTPAFDYLCAQGAFFKRHHSVTSFTIPSVASILTGVYPFSHGLHFQGDNNLADNVPPIAGFFKQAGYRTLATVTEVLNDQNALLSGFDEVERRPDSEQGIHTGWGDAVAKRIQKLNQAGDPWLYLVHSFDLHPQRQCAPEYRNSAWGDNYYDQTLSSVDAYLEPIIASVDLDRTVIVLLGDHGENILFEPSGSEKTAHLAYRIRAGERVDFLREWAFQKGLHSRSKFLLRNNPLMHHDYHLYNFLTHVPLVIVDKSLIGSGRVLPQLTSHVDVLPTLLDLAGLDHPDAAFHGRSLLSMVAGDPDWQEKPVYQELYSAFIYRSRPVKQILEEPLFEGLVTQKLHLIFCPIHPELPPELYDLERDPEERRNLAPAMPDRVRRMQEQLDAVRYSRPLSRSNVTLRS